MGKPPAAEFPPGNKPGPRAAWQGLGCPVGRGGGWKPGGPCPGPSACLAHRGVGSSRSQDDTRGLQARSTQGGSSGGPEHQEAGKGKTATGSTAKASEQPNAMAKLLTHCGQPANARKPSTAGRGGRTQRGAGKSNQGEEEEIPGCRQSAMLPRPPDPWSLSCLFCEISMAPVGGGGAPGFYEKGTGLFRRAEGQSAPAQAEDGTVSELGGGDTCHLQTAFRRSKAATLSSIAPAAKAKRTHQTREGCGECQSDSVASLLKNFPRFPHLPLEVQPLPTANTPHLWGLVLPSPAHPQCRWICFSPV